jgi:hypothetical protein
LVEKSEESRPIGRPKRISEDNIKMDLKDVGWEGVDWIHLALVGDRWAAVVNTVMNLLVL